MDFFHLGLFGTVSILAAAACGGSSTSGGSGGGDASGGAAGSGTGGSAGSSGGSAGTGGSTGTTADAACAAVAQARCARRDACTNGVQTRERFGDLATCESRGKAECLTSLSATGTGAKPDSVAACAAAAPAESCTDLLDNVTPTACAPQPGAGAIASACVFNAQCASAYCSIGANVACGTCAATPKAGDACTSNGDCASGMVCAQNLCVVPAAVGGVCRRDADCQAGLSCVGATKAKPGVCQTAGATVGAACDAKRQTAPECDRAIGLYCDSTSKCATAQLVAAGQPCGQVNGVAVGCLAGATCKLPQGATSGVCEAPAADGAACDVTNGPHCLQPARCVVTGNGTSGTCQLPDPASCK